MGDTQQQFDAELFQFAEYLRPREVIGMADWAEKHFFLSPEFKGYRSGIIQLEPFQRELFDSYSDPTIRKITLMTGAQLTKTLFEMTVCAYTICQNPGPIAIYSDTEKAASLFSKTRFEPMCRDIKPLAALVPKKKSRDSQNTINNKFFPGGSIEFLSAGAPGNVVNRTLMVAIMDEVDQYATTVGDTGDPVGQIEARTVQWGHLRKIIHACTPTIEGSSRIERLFLESDQRMPYVSCPHCGKAQILHFRLGVKFDNTLPTLRDIKDSARYQCAFDDCKYLWTEGERRYAIRNTFQWIAHQPEVTDHAGFWINHLYSLLPGQSLGNLVGEFLKKKDNTGTLKEFLNDTLAELYKEEGTRPAWETVSANSENYAIGLDETLPKGVIGLTAGVDKQHDRLEIAIVGHGPDANNETHSWLVDYIYIELYEMGGNRKATTHPDYWTELEKVLNRKYRHLCGVMLPILCMAIDCGDVPEAVYKFAHRFLKPEYDKDGGLRLADPLTVVCIRGYDTENDKPIHKVTTREAARLRDGAGKDLQIVTLGTGFLKQQLYDSLLSPEGVRKFHTPSGMSKEWYQGVVAEKKIKHATGKIEWKEEYPRNEPLDTIVYAMGAGAVAHADRFKPEAWAKLRARFGITDTIAAPSAHVIPAPVAPVQQRPKTYESAYLSQTKPRW